MKIVCFGDSLTACGGEEGRFSDILADRFPGHVFVNKGVGGESFVEARLRFTQDVLAEKPDVLLLELGAVDWWRNERPPAAWAADLDDFVRRAKANGAQVVILGVFGDYLDREGRRQPKTYGSDERAIAYREMEAEIARRHQCHYIPNIQERIIGERCCWLDANHPNERGNRHVADTIEPILQQILCAPPLAIRKADLYTLRDFWEEAVQLAPRHLAVVDGARRLTYAEADEEVQRLAAGLAAEAGCEKPKVAVFMPNCLEYYLIYWAVMRLGGVIVPLNTWLKEEGLRGIFDRVQPQVLIVQGERDIAPLRAASAAPPRRILALSPGATAIRPYRKLSEHGTAAPYPAIGRDDLAIIMHTSGTTAVPKGAMMRHSDLMFNVATAINAHQFSPRDVHLLINPMFHATALYSMLPTAAYQKATVVIISSTSPDHIMAAIAKERVTTFLSVPAVFQRLLTLRNLEEYDYRSLRLIAYAGSPMPVSTIRQLQRRFPGVDLRNFFGLTETISMTHVLTGAEAETRPDSVGRLLPFVEAKVVDEANRETAAGKVGELIFARENVISGYYGQPELLSAAIVEIDGRQWFRTGDLAMVDAEGYFFIRGRKKDMIIVGGENVFAAEIEAILMAHDRIREAAVKGVPATGARAFLGEDIKAYIVPNDPSLTEAEVRRYCYERLPSYKVPQIIVFLDTLPRNPGGKVVKSELP